MGNVIEGVIITPLKQFPDERGSVKHIIKSTDEGFKGFGEVYCSTINPGVIKGWHYHKVVTLNYTVLKGLIKFVLFDQREGSSSQDVIQEILMGDENYVRVTVPAGIWTGFKCIGTEVAVVCNVIDEPFDETETRRKDLNDTDIPYCW